MRLRFAPLFAALIPCLLFAQDAAPYPIFEESGISPEEYRSRRQAVKRTLGDGEVAVFFTNPTRNRSNDTYFRYRPDSDFRYLTGFDEPDAVLLLAPQGVALDGARVTEVLFVNEPTAQSLTWDGYRMGSRNVPRILGIEAALPNSRFAATLGTLGPSGARFAAPLAIPDMSGSGATLLREFTEWAGGGAVRSETQLRRLLNTLRVKKSPAEIALLQKAVDITVDAHTEAMRHIVPGMWEYQIQALVEHVFAYSGAEAPGYNSIVASGPNSVILHYETNRRKMEDGDILCMDVGAEYRGYSADVTRSFPVNGKFSPEQRAIYEIVLAATDAGVAACKPGASFQEPGRAASRVMAQGLMRLGIISAESELRRYFMHGTSHYIGLDVHDAHGSNTLEAGHVLTVEPGIYIREGSPCDPRWWNIGIRVEDDVLITQDGHVNMSVKAPRTVEEIEGVMQASRLSPSARRLQAQLR
jgi:Xaa-Pro aminopeptidase